MTPEKLSVLHISAVATVVLVALLAAVGYVALKPTYTADEVTKKMESYVQGKVYLDTFRGRTGNCYALVSYLQEATLHYIPYRKGWLITMGSSSDYTWDDYTWLFDERTGTIASSNPQC